VWLDLVLPTERATCEEVVRYGEVSAKWFKGSPSVRRALPPVGWHRTVVHDEQTTTVWACEKTVVMAKHPGHRKEKNRQINKTVN
jgi:hypothetical protein